MTNEEAIKYLSPIVKSARPSNYKASLGVAVSVLRAQQEPVKLDRSRWNGCEWCRQFGSIPLRGFTPHGCTSTTVRYCPRCSKPLAEDAWAELERRINNGANDL